ncbi:siderophore-interacting protein [soil metagenome]
MTAREQVSDHLVRLRVDAPEFGSTGIPDEWVGVIVPGQFQSRYYTVKQIDGSSLTFDVVVHDVGLVTEWARRDVVGDVVTLSEAKGSFAPAVGAEWLMLVGDLTALPAMARISASTDLPVKVWAEVPDDLSGYLPDHVEVTWSAPPWPGGSDLARVVEDIEWPQGPGYFWMAGESGQMRSIRKHLMRERRLPSDAYHVMGYWRGGSVRQPRAIDPGPIWREGQRLGLSDAQIWQQYDQASQQ